MQSVRLVGLTAIAFAVAVPGLALGQTWSGDSGSSRLNWQSVDVLIYPDSTRGVFLWVLTPQRTALEHHRTVSTFLDPVAVDSWVEKAGAVVMASGAPPGDSVKALATPALHGLCGRDVVLLRQRGKHGWSSDIEIIFSTPNRKNEWAVIATRDQARDFLQALAVQGTRSRLKPEEAGSALADEETIEHAPTLLPGHTFVPLRAAPGVNGEIALQFVIQADGTPDPNSFHAALYQDPKDAEVAVAAVKTFRYTPGTINGHPVNTLVETEVRY